MKRIKSFKLFEEAPPMNMDEFDRELNIGFTPEEQERLRQLGADEVSKDVAIFVEDLKNDPGQSYQIRCKRLGAKHYLVQAGPLQPNLRGFSRRYENEVVEFKPFAYPSRSDRMQESVDSFQQMLSMMRSLKYYCDQYSLYHLSSPQRVANPTPTIDTSSSQRPRKWFDRFRSKS